MNELTTWQSASPAMKQALAKKEPVADGGVDFGDTMKKHLQELREVFNQSEDAQRRFMTGELDAESAVMLVNKADLALSYTLELRNRALEAYQEISRMQI